MYTRLFRTAFVVLKAGNPNFPNPFFDDNLPRSLHIAQLTSLRQWHNLRCSQNANVLTKSSLHVAHNNQVQDLRYQDKFSFDHDLM